MAKKKPPAAPQPFEVRVCGVKFRMETREGKNVAVGHAAVFNSESLDLGGFTEIIAPGAFSDVLGSNPDTRALINHDPNLILGRTTPKTLRLKEDGNGLAIEIDMPTGVTYADDMKISMERGDVDQMSFAFRVAPGGDEWKRTARGPQRTVTKVAELNDVSIVTYPAYVDASVAMRSLLAHPEIAMPSVEIVETDETMTTEQIAAIHTELESAKKTGRAAILPKGAHLRCMGYDPYGGSGETPPVAHRCNRAMENCRSAADSIKSVHDAMDAMPAKPSAAEHRSMQQLREQISPLVRSCRSIGARIDHDHPAIRPEGFRDDEMYAMYGGGQEGDESGGGTWTVNSPDGWLTSGTGGSATDDGNGGMPKNDQGQNAVMRNLEMAQRSAEAGEYDQFEKLTKSAEVPG